MSETTTTTPVPQSVDTLWSPQTIVGLFAMTIVAGTIAAIFRVGDPPTIAQTVGGVMTIAGTVIGFYFGSSKGSQSKDAALATSTPTTTTTVTPAATTVTTAPTTTPTTTTTTPVDTASGR
jgi:hypothetical protein